MRVKNPLRSIANFVFRQAPLSAQLIVTRRCNLSCGYCTEYDRVSEMIPLAALKERIDALHRLRVINIALLGGEPLMHPDVAEIVAYIDRKAQASITTNGFLITEPLIRKLNAAGLRNMQVIIDTVKPDPRLFIQKSLKTVRPKLDLLKRIAEFDVFINLVLCEQSKGEFKQTLREFSDLGFAVSLDLVHDSKGHLAIGGPEYLELWEHYYKNTRPIMYLDQDYGTRTLRGEPPAWQCRAWTRFLYVDEFGKAQFCSAQRGRLDKPIVEYTREDAREYSKTHRGCESGCAMLCHYRDSAFDNQPLRTIQSVLKLLGRPAVGPGASGHAEAARRPPGAVATPEAE